MTMDDRLVHTTSTVADGAVPPAHRFIPGSMTRSARGPAQACRQRRLGDAGDRLYGPRNIDL